MFEQNNIIPYMAQMVEDFSDGLNTAAAETLLGSCGLCFCLLEHVFCVAGLGADRKLQLAVQGLLML